MSKRPLMTVAVAVVLAGAACNNDGDQPSTDGSGPAESTVPYEGSPVGTYHAGFSEFMVFNAGYSEFMAFSGYLELMPDGTGRVLSMEGQRPTEGVFEYRIDADRLVVTNGEQSSWYCNPAEPGVYEWARVESVLELEAVDESCEARAAAMQPELGPADPMSWWSMGDVPIVEMRPGDDPVSVETPIGTIEWALVEEQPSLSWLTTFDGGFVALASAEVVVSIDGRSWTPLPPPPVVPEWLGTRGDEVWVATGTSGNASWPPSIYVTDDHGSNWKEVTVDPAPPGVEPRATGAAGGPTGVVLTTQVANPAQGPLLWALGPESFEPVTTPFEGAGVLVDVWALDSGFLAQTRQYTGGTEAPGSFWTSPDGRSWTEGADAPRGFRVQATYGDTVYGTIDEETGGPKAAASVTSLDGGRTWQPASPRPAAGLDVSDIGLVAVEGMAGWGCYGNAFVSSDETEWARALAPWPLTGLTSPFISGDTILIPAFDCTGDTEDVHWIGTLVEASATAADTVQP